MAVDDGQHSVHCKSGQDRWPWPHPIHPGGISDGTVDNSAKPQQVYRYTGVKEME